jgi:D-amino peptidase
MRVALSVDMEGAAGITDMRDCLAACREYWRRGKRLLEADVAAAAEGLLAGGATEIVVLDNHGSGNPENVGAGSLPARARLETWNVFDLREHGVEAMLQVGYHARGGVEGFLSHTYVPGLRLRVGDELISESHGRIWAAEVPLLGIVGNDQHERTLGSLAGTPYLVVQESSGRASSRPLRADGEESAAAIRDFAAAAMREIGSAPRFEPPVETTFAASLPNGAEAVEAMEAGGWTRASEVEYTVELGGWTDARGPLAAAMGAAFGPYMPWWLGDLTSAEARDAADPETTGELEQRLVAWAHESQPEWHTRPAPAIAR